MEATRSSGARSGNSAAYAPPPVVAESLQFEEEMEIQSLIHPPAFDTSSATGKNSFTALLGLTSNQAVELLHHPDSAARPGGVAAGAGSISGGEMWRLDLGDREGVLGLPFGCSPTFPSNAALVERAGRFSAFASEESPASSSCCGGGGCSGSGGASTKPKVEPPDSDGAPICPFPGGERPQQRPGKRKDGKANKTAAKKSKIAEESTGAGGKLPYVHVRARRGQATDSHSLAERARREKINARMKFLQELVPGCSKISGTALVLDEIINHVQSLQRQVEFLSMRLAAVNPRIDFPGLNSFLPPETTRTPTPPWSSEAATAVNGERRQAQQQQQLLWHVDLLHPNPRQHHQQDSASAAAWTRDDAHPNDIFVNPGAGASLFNYAPANPGNCSRGKEDVLDPRRLASWTKARCLQDVKKRGPPFVSSAVAPEPIKDGTLKLQARV